MSDADTPTEAEIAGARRLIADTRAAIAAEDGRTVRVLQSGLRFAYVIDDPFYGPWLSDFRFRSEATALAVGVGDLDWIRAEEAKDENMACPDGTKCRRSCRASCWLAENVD